MSDMNAAPAASRAADILDADDLKRDKVYVPQWNRHVYLRELGGKAAAIIMQRIDEAGEKARWSVDEMVEVISNSVVDETGQRIFKSDEDKARLAGKSWNALMFLFNRIVILGSPVPVNVAAEKKD